MLAPTKATQLTTSKLALFCASLIIFFIYRACIPPFSKARDSILSNSSFLELCHSVPLEVVGLRTCKLIVNTIMCL